MVGWDTESVCLGLAPSLKSKLSKLTSAVERICMSSPCTSLNGQILTVQMIADSLPVMQFLSNKNLQNFKLPSIQRFVTSGQNQVIITDNHPEFFKDIRFCAILQIRAKTKVLYNGQDCSELLVIVHLSYTYHSSHYQLSIYHYIINYLSLIITYHLSPIITYFSEAINTSLPNKIKFNFNKIDFKKDYETLPNWYYDYDETISKSDFKAYQTYFKKLQNYNNITILIAFVLSIPHLFVLFQKELRESWLFVLITAIFICNFLILSTFFLEQLFGMIWNYESRRVCTPKAQYFYVIFHILKTPVKESARRCASILTFSLTLLHFLSMIKPVISTPFRTAFLAFMTLAVLLALQFSQILPCKTILVESSTM